MTVSYQYDVASSTSGGFTRLLLKWKGSLYKLIYREMIAFLVLFIIVSLLYRFVLTEPQQRYFEVLVRFFERYLEMIPLSFVLGFYVTTIATRWWQQYVALPWPDKLMLCVSLYIPGKDEESRLVRRSLMRYTNLMMILVLRSISLAVKRRFPTLEHVVESGIMTKKELERFQSIQTEFNTYWIPSCWFVDLLRECRTKKMIIDPPGMRLIMEEFLDIRSKCSLLWSYDWISIPLVYTQVVTLATYTFYLACVVARQNVIGNSPDKLVIDDYFPVFTVFQLLFYMGLLKVAEQMINPFGDDDEDFELNFLIDRHTKVSYLVVDLIHQNSPPIEKDLYFDEIDPTLPYTEASVHHKKNTYKGSAADMVVPQKKQTLSIPVSVDESIDEESSMRSFPAHREEYRGHTLESIAERLGHAKSSFARKQIPRNLSSSSRIQENSGFESDYTLESGLRTVTPATVLPDTGLQPKNNLSPSSPCNFPVSKRKYSTNQRPSLFQSQMLNLTETEGGESDTYAEFVVGGRPVPMRRSKRECKTPAATDEKPSAMVEKDDGVKESNYVASQRVSEKVRVAEADSTDLEDDGL